MISFLYCPECKKRPQPLITTLHDITFKEVLVEWRMYAGEYGPYKVVPLLHNDEVLEFKPPEKCPACMSKLVLVTEVSLDSKKYVLPVELTGD